MISRINERYFSLSHYADNPLDYNRARSLFYLIGILFVATLLGSGITIYNFITQPDYAFTTGQVLQLLVPLVAFLLSTLLRRGNLTLSAYGLVTILTITSSSTLVNGIDDSQIITIMLPLITAGMVLRWRGVIVTALALITFVSFAAINQDPATVEGGQPIILFWGQITQTIFFSGILLILVGNNLQQIAADFVGQLQRLRGIASQLNLSAVDVTERELVTRAINLARDTLGYTYAQVYLVDSSLQIQRHYASGLNVAQVIMDTDVQANVSRQVYEVLQTREPVRIGPDDARNEHIAPGMSVSLTMPLMHRKELLGIIDLQREDRSEIARDEIETATLLANQLGNTLAQVQLLSSLREDINDQQNIITQQREKLRRIEQSDRDFVARTWSDYFVERGSEFVGFDLSGTQLEPALAADITDDLRPALETGQIAVEEDGEHQIISIPIVLRGQLLGAMSCKVPKGQQSIGPRQTELVRNVTQRLAMALENKRLFEQSQSQAQRESKANEIGGLLLSTTDIETVLELAANQFNDALDAIQTRIHLQPKMRQIAEEPYEPSI